MSDLGTIQQTATLLFRPGAVTELRILDTPRTGTVAGYFDDLDKFAHAAAQWSGKAPAVYATLNPCKRGLLARAANRLKERARTTTNDSDVLHRAWLPLDFDPVRPAGISSTDAEHGAALDRAEACTRWLQARGWPSPVAADSGNGAHRLYAIDLPNDEASKELLRRCLEALALHFSDEAVCLDLSVFNASRIWKVYGTRAGKGDHTPERPHRLSTLLDVPDPIEAVTPAQLTALAALIPEPSAAPRGPAQREAFDLARWISVHGLSVVSEDTWQQSGHVWRLSPCPWNDAHTNRAAFIARHPSGAIIAGCHHNGCAGNDWPALRQLYEPDWIPYFARTHGATASRNGVRDDARAREVEDSGLREAGMPLSSLSSLSSQEEAKQAEPITAPDDDLSSLSSLSSQGILQIREEALYGIAGKVVRTILPHSESDTGALLLQFLAKFGVLVGRTPYYLVESTRHYPNLFVVLVGASSKARKGTAYDNVEAIMHTVDTSWTRNNVIGGCGSGEGLIHAVRDRVTKREPLKVKGKATEYKEVEVDPGIIDKRLLVHEPEFASVLKVGARDGNILSMTLRQAWDSGNLQNSVKTDPQKATGAHIAVIGHVTADELKKLLTTTDAANGFANRFLWLYVTRSKALPDGGALSGVDMQPLITRVRDAHRAAITTGRMTRDREATVAWHAIYAPLSDGKPGIPGAILARGEAQVLRLSMLYALLDCSAVIRKEHLYAALAVWEYVEASVVRVFGATTGNKEADTLYEALRGAQQGKIARWDIIKEVFHGHIKAYDLNEAIRTLVDAGCVTREYAATPGRRKEYICYGNNGATSTTLMRARAQYIDLSKQAVATYNASQNDRIPCEESEESEERVERRLDTDAAKIVNRCEESEESEERVQVDDPEEGKYDDIPF